MQSSNVRPSHENMHLSNYIPAPCTPPWDCTRFSTGINRHSALTRRAKFALISIFLAVKLLSVFPWHNNCLVSQVHMTMPFGFILTDNEQFLFGLVSTVYNITKWQRDRRDYWQSQGVWLFTAKWICGVNCQLINHHSSDFNKFEIPLT